MKNSSLADYLRCIFRYEFDSGRFGLEKSEYTNEIIDVEASRLAKHREPLEPDKVYTVSQTVKQTKLTKFESLEEAATFTNTKCIFESVYIIFKEFILVPMDYGDKVELEIISSVKMGNIE